MHSLDGDVGLLAHERQQAILLRVRSDKTVRIKDLAADLGVHEMTIRRDLDQLSDRGHVERFHGGARIRESRAEELSHVLRFGQNRQGKEAMARAANALIQDGDTVALDASTSSLALVRELSRRDVFAFVTSLDAAEILAAGERPFALLGGTFHHSARSFVGALFNDTLVNIHPDKVVMSAKGYTPEAGFTDPHLAEAEAKILLRKSGATVIVLIDHTKIGRRSLMTVARTEDVHVLVTDEEPPQAVRLALERADVRLIVA